MPFREKAKNLFRTMSNRDDSLTQTTTNSSTDEAETRYPSNVYKPGEPMPRPKYRAIPKPEHKAKLEAFSFGDAWRKRSFQSSHSPMGTRAGSRRASLFSDDGGKKSRRQSQSEDTASVSRNGSSSITTSGETDKTSVSNLAATKVDEQLGDDDVANVGLSKPAPKGELQSLSSNAESNQLHKTVSTARDHHPFSEHDLELAMRRSNLQVSAQS